MKFPKTIDTWKAILAFAIMIALFVVVLIFTTDNDTCSCPVCYTDVDAEGYLTFADNAPPLCLGDCDELDPEGSNANIMLGSGTIQIGASHLLSKSSKLAPLLLYYSEFAGAFSELLATISGGVIVMGSDTSAVVSIAEHSSGLFIAGSAVSEQTPYDPWVVLSRYTVLSPSGGELKIERVVHGGRNNISGWRLIEDEAQIILGDDEKYYLGNVSLARIDINMEANIIIEEGLVALVENAYSGYSPRQKTFTCFEEYSGGLFFFVFVCFCRMRQPC